MNQTSICILLFSVLLSANTLTGQCFSSEGRTKLMPLGVHLMGLQKKQDSLQMAILSTNYLCLEKGDESNIEFTDGSFIYITNLLELNCDGKAYFHLSDNDLQQLSTKEIAKVVLGSRYKGYTTTATPESGEASEFQSLIKCAMNSSFTSTNTQIQEASESASEMKEVPVQVVQSQPSTSQPITSEPSTSQQVISTSVPISVIVPTKDIPPLRTIQFIATTGGQTFDELAYLGTIISEKVANKNLYRYKIQGNFTDPDVQHVIASLAIHGYKGAFENK